MIQSYIRVVFLERPILPPYEAGPCPPSDGYWLPFEVGRGFLFEVSIVPLCDQQLVTTRGESLPQGGTLIFSYIRRLGPFFLVQNFEFRYVLGFQKNKYFLVYENFVDIFLESSQNWIIFRGHFYAFQCLFLRSRYRIGDIFGGF